MTQRYQAPDSNVFYDIGQDRGVDSILANAAEHTRDRWPRLCVRHLCFRDGTYTTDDPEEQALIEGLKYYGVHIHEAQG